MLKLGNMITVIKEIIWYDELFLGELSGQCIGHSINDYYIPP